MGSRARVIAAAWLVAALASLAQGEEISALSSAERTARAKVHFELGRAHFRIEDFEAARKEFEQAYLYKPLPLLLFDLAQVNLRLGRHQRALELFQAFLEENPKGPQHDEASAQVNELNRLLANRHSAAQPEPPAPSHVAPWAAGASPAPAVPAAVPLSPPPTAGAVTATMQPSLLTKPSSAAHWRGKRIALWTGLGGAAVLVGVAVTLGVVFAARTKNPTPTEGVFVIGP